MEDENELLRSQLKAAQQLKAQKGARERSHLAEVNAQQSLQLAQQQHKEVQDSIRESEKALRSAEGERLEAVSRCEALLFKVRVRKMLAFALQRARPCSTVRSSVAAPSPSARLRGGGYSPSPVVSFSATD